MGWTNTASVEIAYTATDMVSNVTPVKTQNLIIDADAPTVDVFAKAVDVDGVRYISSKDPIYVEAFDTETAVAGIFYSTNGSEYMPYDAEIGINLTIPGSYSVTAKAVDVVGNESAPVEYNVVVDMSAPSGDAMYSLDVVRQTPDEREEIVTEEDNYTYGYPQEGIDNAENYQDLSAMDEDESIATDDGSLSEDQNAVNVDVLDEDENLATGDEVLNETLDNDNNNQ